MSRKKSMSEVKTNLQNMPMMTAQITAIGTKSRQSSEKLGIGEPSWAGREFSGLRASGGLKLGSLVSEGGALPIEDSRASVTEPLGHSYSGRRAKTFMMS